MQIVCIGSREMGVIYSLFARTQGRVTNCTGCIATLYRTQKRSRQIRSLEKEG